MKDLNLYDFFFIKVLPNVYTRDKIKIYRKVIMLLVTKNLSELLLNERIDCGKES